jgi:uncharacterized OB-fold protein
MAAPDDTSAGGSAASSLPTSPPPTTPETQPYFDALAEGRIELPVCDACGHWIFYPRSFCPVCGCRDVTWREATGRGSVYSYSVTRQAPGRWGGATPYVLAYVELDEGPRMLTNVVGGDVEAVHIGMVVELEVARTEDGAVPRFRPAAG